MKTYKDAGVNIDEGNLFVEELKHLVQKTRRSEVLADVGPFAGLFALQKYHQPVLVAAADGVGTKVKLANQFQKWKGIGQDCVAMCVNDVGCFGAEPLFFLDYLATAKLNRIVLKEIVEGMAEACLDVGCALLGGETAEMPGVYPPEEFDCAGFVVGVVEKDEIVDGKNIVPGDAVIGVASSGFHSNGFSLIRKILRECSMNLNMPCAETGLTLAETLLVPTKLYTPLVLHLKKRVVIKGIAHITGGGLVENPPRILPEGVQIKIQKASWPIPETMLAFKEKGNLRDEEFFKVFNAGIGLILIVSQKEETTCLKQIADFGEKAYAIGKVHFGKPCQVLFR